MHDLTVAIFSRTTLRRRYLPITSSEDLWARVDVAFRAYRSGDRARFSGACAVAPAVERLPGPWYGRWTSVAALLDAIGGILWQAAGYVDVGRTRVQLYFAAIGPLLSAVVCGVL